MKHKFAQLPRPAKRAIVGIVGILLLIIGIVAIPYPGPGWLIVIAALAILATEFVWAQNLLDIVKTKYDAWHVWIARQTWPVKLLFWCVTAIVVVLTIWLLNGYGFIDSILHLHQSWVHTPVPLFR